MKASGSPPRRLHLFPGYGPVVATSKRRTRKLRRRTRAIWNGGNGPRHRLPGGRTGAVASKRRGSYLKAPPSSSAADTSAPRSRESRRASKSAGE